MESSTIQYYNKNAQTYFESTVSLDMGKLYEPFLQHLKPGAKILDAGCGSGRDSLFFKNHGFQVTAFDASEEMVKLASQLLGQRVLHMSFEDLDLPETYDGIWACASLLHVKRAELRNVIARLTQHLNTGGMLYMSFKYGGGEYWKDGRYFHCLDEIGLHKTIERIPKLKVAQLFVSIDVRSDRTEERWLNAYLVRG
jgi:SAM-dependent methyltransferase